MVGLADSQFASENGQNDLPTNNPTSTTVGLAGSRWASENDQNDLPANNPRVAEETPNAPQNEQDEQNNPGQLNVAEKRSDQAAAGIESHSQNIPPRVQQQWLVGQVSEPPSFGFAGSILASHLAVPNPIKQRKGRARKRKTKPHDTKKAVPTQSMPADFGQPFDFPLPMNSPRAAQPARTLWATNLPHEEPKEDSEDEIL